MVPETLTESQYALTAMGSVMTESAKSDVAAGLANLIRVAFSIKKTILFF